MFREMERLCSEYGVREFHFVDDMFNLSKRRVIEFCRILEDKRWGISYSFPNGLRLNTIDREMLDWMKKTGAYAFTVGIESGSQRVLDLMNKQLTVEMIREKVQLIHEVGLEPSGFFLLGFPGETKQEMRMTLELAKSLPLKRAHFSNFPAPPWDRSHAQACGDGRALQSGLGTTVLFTGPVLPCRSHQRRAETVPEKGLSGISSQAAYPCSRCSPKSRAPSTCTPL